MQRFGDLLISTITYDPERFYLFVLFIYSGVISKNGVSDTAGRYLDVPSHT